MSTMPPPPPGPSAGDPNGPGPTPPPAPAPGAAASPYGGAPAAPSPQAAPYGGAPGQPGQPGMPPPPSGDPNNPGSKAFVEQRFGPQAEFGDRVVPYIVDSLIVSAAMFVPMLIGMIIMIASSPDQEPCWPGAYVECSVPGTGSGAGVAFGLLLFFLGWLAGLGVLFWNRIWKVSKTGQSIGRKMGGLKVVNAQTGELPTMGQAFLRELINGVAGLIAILWMLFDDDKRTLADKGASHAVIKVPKG